MKFTTKTELKRKLGTLHELIQKDDVVLTSNGKPVALLIRLESHDVEESLFILRQARTHLAHLRMK
jgi:antitoxin (DNA-binding transcriptional repressor) of toxin-antitoxin stability system